MTSGYYHRADRPLLLVPNGQPPVVFVVAEGGYLGVIVDLQQAGGECLV